MTYLHSYHKTLGISSNNDIISLETAILMLYYFDIYLYFELLKAKDSGYSLYRFFLKLSINIVDLIKYYCSLYIYVKQVFYLIHLSVM